MTPAAAVWILSVCWFALAAVEARRCSERRVSTFVPAPGRISSGRGAEGIVAACCSRRGKATTIVCLAKGKKSSKRKDPKREMQGFGGPSSDPRDQVVEAVASELVDAGEQAAPSPPVPPSTLPQTGTGFVPKPTRQEIEVAYSKAMNKLQGQDAPGAGPGVLKGVTPVPDIGQNRTITRIEIGVLDIIPQGIQTGVEIGLIGALSINLLIIVGLGTGFALEALTTTKLELGEGVLSAINSVKGTVDKYQGAFSPSLVTFFVLSSLLGALKLGQLGRGSTTYTEGATYRED